MGEPTPNLSLARPDEGDTDWAGEINENWGKIDEVCGANNCCIETGTYTGDDTTDKTVNLADSSMVVKYVRIWQRFTADGDARLAESSDVIVDDNANGMAFVRVLGSTGVYPRAADHSIISLGTGNFHVDDGGANSFPNTNGVLYNYVAMGTH